MNYVRDMYLIDFKKYVAPYSQSKYLVASSCFFLVPAFYGYINQEYVYSSVALVVSLCSINFWRDANYSYRRVVDHITAKASFTLFVTHGVQLITYKPYLFISYGNLIGLVYCYYMSNKCADTDIWWKYHMMFHLLVACNKIIIIRSVLLI